MSEGMVNCEVCGRPGRFTHDIDAICTSEKQFRDGIPERRVLCCNVYRSDEPVSHGSFACRDKASALIRKGAVQAEMSL